MKLSKEMHRLAKEGAVTRREFSAMAMSLGVPAATAVSIWGKGARAAPKRGGQMTIGIDGGATTDSLNPELYETSFMIVLGFSIRNNLTQIAPDNSLAGALAESWEPNANATQWTFSLRKGVEFHNGKSLEAEDIVASINLHRGKDSTSGAKGELTSIEDISADGKEKVVFKLSGANVDFPYVLTDYHLNIVPAKGGKADWTTGVGTGAYKLEHFNPGVSATVTLNPNRWEQDVGFVESAELLLVNDADARQSGLLEGQLHAINRADVKTVDMMKRSPKVRILDIPGRMIHSLPMDTRKEPFSSNDFRLALKYAIDRDEYLEKILRGYGSLGNDNPIGPAYRYHAADIPQRVYDPDKARHHLKKSGYENREVTLSSADFVFSSAVDAAVLYQAQALKAGIKIKVEREPNDGYWTNVWMKKPWCVSYWGPRPTEDMILSVAYLGDAPWNETHWNNERLNHLIVQARGTLDDNKRAEMYREIQLILRDKGGSVVPASAHMVHAVAANVGTPEQISNSWELDGGHCVKRWWLN